MGNEQSQMSSLVLDEKALEVTDFWSHYSASINSGNLSTVSVFISEPIADKSLLWTSQSPLEKFSKNLMLHRHPCILRYISSWNKGSKHFLAVEPVRPLSHVISMQSPLQICIGLHSVLKALVFLHENAQASHNNVCVSSIYVTKEGNWKLGNLEYLCKLNNGKNGEFLNKTRMHRCKKAVDPSEERQLKSTKSSRMDFIDVFAFGALVREVFVNKSEETIPQLDDFLDTCKMKLQDTNIENRPKLSSLLQDSFFNHEFIVIYSFLSELPLKCDEEKEDFFKQLILRLKTFNETTIATQLGTLLLSRLVLLNQTAQREVIPFVLTLKEQNSECLFSEATFKKFLVPKILEIFSVRDAQIRLLLLKHFNGYMQCFTKEQLKVKLLPELLVGIKDTNDLLVAVTLRSLADLMPILGSSTVIGGKRAKLFNDSLLPSNNAANLRNFDSVSFNSINTDEVLSNNDTLDVLSNSSTITHLNLNERPSPDGEEGESSTLTDDLVVGQAEDLMTNTEWDDWDINNEELNTVPTDTFENSVQMNNELAYLPSNSNHTLHHAKLPELTDLDIKNQSNVSDSVKISNDIDFFEDMEPIIKTPSKFLVEIVADSSSGVNNLESSSLLSVKDIEHHEEGWDDDLDEWD